MKKIVLFILAVVFIASCVEKSEKNDLKTLSDLDKALRQGKYDFVVKHCKRYLNEYPESDQAWLLLGWTYAKKNNLNRAKESFETVLSINKTNDNAYVGLGSVYRKFGNNDKARDCYSEAIRICPNNPEALSSLLVIELLEGRYEEAVKCGEKAWEHNKVMASIPANLCIAYHYQGNSAKRDYYYTKAKDLKYGNMDNLDDLIAGRTTIGGGTPNNRIDLTE